MAVFAIGLGITAYFNALYDYKTDKCTYEAENIEIPCDDDWRVLMIVFLESSNIVIDLCNH